MSAITFEGVTHRYGRRTAVQDINLHIAPGAFLALLGPNGAGKTTLIRIMVGLLRPSTGTVTILDKDVRQLKVADRSRIGYVAQDQGLPDWMTLKQLESYLAPMYDRWDRSLADDLRNRFDLDPARKLKNLSRGEQMKAALLCALAPRPDVLIMDEPFSGMDAVVKDELVRGLLESAGTEGWTVVVSSHDLAELENLADSVAFLDRGQLLYNGTMEQMHETFVRVDVLLGSDSSLAPIEAEPGWLSFERSGKRVSFVVRSTGLDPVDVEVKRQFVGAASVETQPASLRDVFVGLARARTNARAAKVEAVL